MLLMYGMILKTQAQMLVSSVCDQVLLREPEADAEPGASERAQVEQAECGAAGGEAQAQPLPHHLRGRQHRAGMYSLVTNLQKLESNPLTGDPNLTYELPTGPLRARPPLRDHQLHDQRRRQALPGRAPLPGESNIIINSSHWTEEPDLF